MASDDHVVKDKKATEQLEGQAQTVNGSPRCDGNHGTASTQFNAYPLEFSSNLINTRDDVVYMPFNPSNVPLSFSAAPRDIETTDFRNGSQPVCHGLLFPYLSDESMSDCQISNQKTSTMGWHNTLDVEKENLSSDFDRALDIDPNIQLQMLILQHLLTLHCLKQGADQQQSPGSTSLSNKLANTKLEDNFLDTSGFGGTPDVSTFLVPVEATFKNDPGFVLQIKPRAEEVPSGSSSDHARYVMNCPSNQLVLHPVQDSSVSPNVCSEAGNAYVYDTQAFTLNNLKSRVEKGSLDLRTDESNKFLVNMNGRTKPGFVLLSVKHEKISQLDHSSKETGTQYSPPADQQTVCEETGTPGLPYKKAFKRKQRLSRCETNAHRRSSKKSPRSSLMQFQLERDNDEALLTRASSSVSRFRVSRFADKKQIWLAPVGAGCFSVHDLWTKNLPNYVLKFSAMTGLMGSAEYQSSPQLFQEIASDTECIFCRNSPSYSCSCGSDSTGQTHKEQDKSRNATDV